MLPLNHSSSAILHLLVMTLNEDRSPSEGQYNAEKDESSGEDCECNGGKMCPNGELGVVDCH